MRRASVSVMSHIAEGFERGGTGEFLRFLAVAKGSAGEVKTQLYAAFDQGHIDKEILDRLSHLANENGRIKLVGQ